MALSIFPVYLRIMAEAMKIIFIKKFSEQLQRNSQQSIPSSVRKIVNSWFFMREIVLRALRRRKRKNKH